MRTLTTPFSTRAFLTRPATAPCEVPRPTTCFCQCRGAQRVRMLIWERGVGPTKASAPRCGGSAVARLSGGASRDVEVISPGGSSASMAVLRLYLTMG